MAAANEQPYDTRTVCRFLLSSLNAGCSILVMSHHVSQTVLHKVAPLAATYADLGDSNLPCTNERTDSMKSSITFSLALPLSTCLCISLLVSQEQPLKEKDVPKSVIAAFAKAYPNAKAKGFTRETSEGKVCYEIESVEGKTTRDILYDPDGNALVVEESLLPNQLPDLVRQALDKQFSKAQIQKCEKLTKGSTVQYELFLRSGKSTQEVVFNEDGKVSKTEKK